MSSEHNNRLSALRAELQAAGLDGFIIPRADEHLGEYVPESAERLAFMTGFTGSAGLGVVLSDKAAVWSDGRYVLQLAQETDAALWEQLHITTDKPELWLKRHATNQQIGYDPWLVSADFLKRFEGVELVPVAHNPVDAVWTNRPAPPLAPAMPYGDDYAGESAAAKRARLGAALREAGQDAAVISDPAGLAWLFNIRGADVAFCPVALGFALLFADGTAALFMAPEKVSPELRMHLGNQVTVAGREGLPGALQALTGKTVRYDSATMPSWFKTTLEEAGAIISQGDDPVALPRACKNAVELHGARAAHLRDAAAMVTFLAWAAERLPTGAETEISAATKLLQCREAGALFRGESFPAISGAGEHGAIIHYRVTPESNRAIEPDEVYLIDSGGQYLDGTTDITRTLWTGPGAAPAAIKAHVTRVLAGMIALSQAVFPEGVAGPHLDVLARNALWQAGLDYDHGTGHGVGSYLSVHEGPAGISRAAKPVALQPGMILSNEPGYYLPGAYGIRMENLILVQPAPFDGPRKFLQFETLTLVPFDRALIDPALLSATAIEWLNAYHARVWEQVGPLVEEDARRWLQNATNPL
jgi:Xaa-Pro aminopeptidase